MVIIQINVPVIFNASLVNELLFAVFSDSIKTCSAKAVYSLQLYVTYHLYYVKGILLRYISAYLT